MTAVDVKVRFNVNSIMRIRKFTCNGSRNEIDETDSESGGYGECRENGIAQQDVTFEGYIRRADGSPPVEGDLYTNVLIALDGNVANPDVNKRYLFSELKVFGVEIMGETKGGSIAYTLTCKSSGQYKPPGIA